MKRILLDSLGNFSFHEIPVPEAGPGEALVKIRKVGVCGSDIHLYRTGAIGNIRTDGPLVIGHECMGEVVDVGSDSDRDRVGERVAIEPAIPCGHCIWCTSDRSNLCPNIRFLGLPPVHGAMQEYLVHPLHLLKSLPETLDDAAAVMLEPLAVALHAINLAKAASDHTVAILGTGVIGTCVLSLLRQDRDLRIICVDPLEERLHRAKKMGADHVLRPTAVMDRHKENTDVALLNAIRTITDGNGVQCVFECSGERESLWNMIELATPGAHVAIIGSNPDDRVLFSAGSARRKGLTLRFVRRSLNTLDACIRMTLEGKISPENLVTHTFKATAAAQAFETVDKYEDGVLKALIDMESWE